MDHFRLLVVYEITVFEIAMVDSPLPVFAVEKKQICYLSK